MFLQPDADGLTASCTLVEWVRRGPLLPQLGRLTRVEILGLDENATVPTDVPPALALAAFDCMTGGDADALSALSAECLNWARQVARTVVR